MKKTEYAVDTTLTYPGKFFVYAKNEDAARELVETKCWKCPSKACSSSPSNVEGWDFPYNTIRTIGVVVEVDEKGKPVETSVTKRVAKKKRHAVEIAFSRSGTFYISAKNEDGARKMVEKYCRQRYPRYRSSLPPNEVAWEFPRKNITKTITGIKEAGEW